MEKYEESTKLSRKNILINNFLGGISWAFGATIGFSLLIAILGIIATQINFIPYFGSFASHIIDYVLQTNVHLRNNP